MKTTQPIVRSRAGCTRLAAVAALLWVPMAAHAADAGPSKPAAKSSAVTLQPVAGSSVKRVVLSAKAAERLGIETGTVREEPIVFRQMVSGLVVAPVDKAPVQKPGGGTFGGFAQAAGGPQAAAARCRAESPRSPSSRRHRPSRRHRAVRRAAPQRSWPPRTRSLPPPRHRRGRTRRWSAMPGCW